MRQPYQRSGTEEREAMGCGIFSPDHLKLQSCMTLFAEVAENEDVFQKVLDKFFNGEKDRHALQILGKRH
ncbi:MAG: DUF1810 domain-containing protein [Lachnospiraceae bacterium]|nr:DUF1810 domain-containing protein [Lachnospiraceae bacterium]